MAADERAAVRHRKQRLSLRLLPRIDRQCPTDLAFILYLTAAWTPRSRRTGASSPSSRTPTNLVPGDTNGSEDVFVRDRQTGTTERVSVGPGGVRHCDSVAPSISADGRFVAFDSDASNLVPGDTNGCGGRVRARPATGTTRRVSVGPGGVQGNGGATRPSISADGRFVAFDSDASNLVPGDTNGFSDVFVRDRQTGTTERVSVGPGGVQGNGRQLRRRRSRRTGASSPSPRMPPTWCRATPTAARDVFVRDRQTGTTERVSVGPGGVQGNGDS